MISNPTTDRHLRRPAASPRMKLAVYAALFGAVVTGALAVPLPVLTMHPGPTPDVSKLITIEGAPTFPSNGSFHMTTVTVRPATFVSAVQGWIDNDIAVIPKEAVYPPGKSQEEIVQENAAAMDESGVDAAVAAFRNLGMLGPPEGVLVLATTGGTPAARVLEAGDVIVKADGQTVTAPKELVDAVQKHRIGDVMTLTYRRDGEEKDARVRLVANPDAKARPMIGVKTDEKYKLPYEVKLDPQNIGGPSAGLMFSLSIVDRLKPEDLTHGHTIAGTGTIDAGGHVGAVGGVAQKVEAAEKIEAGYFLAPRDGHEADEARKALDSDMRVIEVDTLDDAVKALENLE